MARLFGKETKHHDLASVELLELWPAVKGGFERQKVELRRQWVELGNRSVFFCEFFFTGFALLCLGINKHGRNVMTGKMPESRPLCHALPVRVITVCVLGDMRSTGVPVHKYIEHFAFLFHISRTCLV